MNYYLIIYFVVGVVEDFLLTLSTRFIAAGKPISATIFSFFSTVVTMLVLYNILTQLDKSRSIVAIIVYALGISMGTLAAMLIKKK